MDTGDNVQHQGPETEVHEDHRWMNANSRCSSAALCSVPEKTIKLTAPLKMKDDVKILTSKVDIKSNEKSSKSETDLIDAASPLVEESFEDSTDGSTYEPSEFSDDELTFEEVPNRGSKKTYSKKRHNCFVCGKSQSKISRHLFTHRNQEPEIARAFALRRKSKERKKLLKQLLNKGKPKPSEQDGEQLNTHDTSVRSPPRNPVTCILCKTVYDREEIWQHMQSCFSQKLKKSATQVSKSPIVTLITAIGLPDPQNLSSGVRKMLGKLKKDEIGSIVLKDPYILQLAQCLYLMTEQKGKESSINSGLRLMGRLLLTLRKKSINSFDDVKPDHFNRVVEAVREIAVYNEETKTSAKATLTSRLGKWLKKIADIKYAKAVKEEVDKEKIEDAETFMKQCAAQWPSMTPKQSNVPSPATIPFIQDVQILYQNLLGTAASAIQSLTLYKIPPVYNALLRATLAHVYILNKHTVRISKVTLESFKERAQTELQTDAPTCQSRLKQILSMHRVKIKVSCKDGENIALFLTPELLSAITLLVSKREACGVHEENPFLFGRADAPPTSFFLGNACVKSLLYRCDEKYQDTLRSVYFHKHIARIFQILSFTNEELFQLASLLGHDICIDQEFYQMPEAAKDIAKISQLLWAMEDGCLERFEGKSFEEIEIPDELHPVLEACTPENSDAEECNEESSQQSGNKRRRRGSSLKKHIQDGVTNTQKETELTEENQENMDNTEDMPVNSAVQAPEEETLFNGKNETSVYFSDDAEDMNEDFHMDDDTDDNVRVEDKEENGDSLAKAVVTTEEVMTADSSDSSESTKEDTVRDREKSINREDNVQDQVADTEVHEEHGWMNAKAKANLAAALGMKDVKILIPKLDIAKVQDRVHISELSTLKRKQPADSEPPTNKRIRSEQPSTLGEVTDDPSNAKDVLMNCSQCKKNMMKGHTAYQKKGFTEVFCSKKCLFDMFSRSKQTSRTCHLCEKGITEILDLIIAAVDKNGTMKDFCSPACLCSFKYNELSILTIQPSCKVTRKACTEVNVDSDSAVEEAEDSSAAALKKLILTDSDILCCKCGQKLSKGQTLYQLRNSMKVFCSSSCLSGRNPTNISVERKCYNCLQVILRRQNIILAPVDESGTVKELCGNDCLSSVQKKLRFRNPRGLCKMCSKVRNCAFKLTLNHEIQRLCSETCVIGYHKLHNLPGTLCEVCVSVCSDKPLVMKVEDQSKAVCSDRCLLRFKEKVDRPQLCPACQTSHQMSDMVEKETAEGLLEFFCSHRCVMVYKDQSVTVSEKKTSPFKEVNVKEEKPPIRNCANIKEEVIDEECSKFLPASVSSENIKDEQFAVRVENTMVHKELTTEQPANGCILITAADCCQKEIEPTNEEKHISVVEKTHNDVTDAPTADAAPVVTQTDSQEPPEELLCAQCQNNIKTKPRVIQTKETMSFVCSLKCSEEFKRVKNIKATCEYCKTDQIIEDVKRIDGKDCYFCSIRCKGLFHDKLEKKWGQQFGSCVYCLSLCKNVVTMKFKGSGKEFCSKDCSSKSKKLLSCMAKCDSCDRKRRLKESLPLVGEVKHFCDLDCLLQFCRKHQQRIDAESSTQSSGTTESSPVITSVISLAAALAERKRAALRQQAALKDFIKSNTTKVFENVSTQTDPKELKNKSVMCTPLVHNKGMCCRTQTVETEAQTDKIDSEVTVLPVPASDPLPVSIKSQFTSTSVDPPVPVQRPCMRTPRVSSSDKCEALMPSFKPLDDKCKDKISLSDTEVTENQSESDDDGTAVETPQDERTQEVHDNSDIWPRTCIRQTVNGSLQNQPQEHQFLMNEPLSDDLYMSHSENHPKSYNDQSLSDGDHVAYSTDEDGETSDAAMSMMCSLSKAVENPEETVVPDVEPSNMSPTIAPIGLGTSKCSILDIIGAYSAERTHPANPISSEVEAEISEQESTRFSFARNNYCFVCGKPQSKVLRHLKTHKTNPEIIHAYSFPENSKERKLMLGKLRNKGNFKHNSAVLRRGTGSLKMRRKTNSKTLAGKFIHCLYCQGMFIRKDLWRHVRRCHCKPDEMDNKSGKTRVLGWASIPNSESFPEISCGVWKLLGAMKQGNVASAVRNDPSVIEYAIALYNKHGEDPAKYEYMRQRLREVGRLLLCLRDDFSLYGIEEAVKPSNFQKVVQAVKKVSGFEEETSTYRTPSLARKLGYTLNKICDILHRRAVKAEDEVLIKSTCTFKKLYTYKWSELVSSSALNSKTHAKYNKPSTLTFTEDVQVLHNFLDKSVEVAFGNLKDEANIHNYTRLAKLTLSQVIVFNCRTAGEISKMLLNSFRESDNSKLNEDVSRGLANIQPKLSDYFKNVEIVGSFGHKDLIFLTPQMMDALSLLTNKRTECGVCSTNVFLFAKPKSMSHYKGQNCLREYASRCEAKHPEHLRRSYLQKHVAAVSQVLHLKNKEPHQLADFLRHNISVHQDFFRLPLSTTHLAKICKLLLLIEKGEFSNLQGKSLDEIEIEDDISPSDKEVQDSQKSDDKGTAAETPEAGKSETGVFASNSTLTQQDHDTGTSGLPGKDAGQELALQGISKRKWSKAEEAAVMRHLENHIREGKTPSLHDCRRCKKAEHAVLAQRTELNIKDFVRNRGIAAKRLAQK